TFALLYSSFFFSSRRRHTRWPRDWSSDVCSSDLGRDIVRTWLYYTTLKTWLLEGRKPFEHAWITGLGMDKQGRKMSKSLGNVIRSEERRVGKEWRSAATA